METKTYIYIGIFIGSIVGGMIGSMIGDGLFSMWGIILGTLGSLVGIWAGYKLGNS